MFYRYRYNYNESEGNRQFYILLAAILNVNTEFESLENRIFFIFGMGFLFDAVANMITNIINKLLDD